VEVTEGRVLQFGLFARALPAERLATLLARLRAVMGSDRVERRRSSIRIAPARLRWRRSIRNRAGRSHAGCRRAQQNRPALPVADPRARHAGAGQTRARHDGSPRNRRRKDRSVRGAMAIVR
jgi:hypothetical protein